MADKVQVNIKKQNGQQNSQKPYVYSFRPVHLETSVDVVQKYNHYSSAQQHFQGQSIGNRKAKCPVRRTQNIFFVITLIIIAFAFIAYYSVPAFAKFVQSRIVVYTQYPIVDWLSGDYILLFGSFAVAVFLASVIVRWILHPIGCKARRNKRCCSICEFHKYLWTAMFVGIVSAYLFAANSLFGFEKVAKSSLAVINDFIASGFSFSHLASLKPEHLLPFICIILSVVVFVVLVVVTFRHLSRDKRMAFLDDENENYNQYNPQNNMNGGYNQGMYNGNNPYNNDRVYYAPTKNGSFVGKFFKALAIIVVIALVYCAVAYLVPGLPLHNTLKNIL